MNTLDRRQRRMVCLLLDRNAGSKSDSMIRVRQSQLFYRSFVWGRNTPMFQSMIVLQVVLLLLHVTNTIGFVPIVTKSSRSLVDTTSTTTTTTVVMQYVPDSTTIIIAAATETTTSTTSLLSIMDNVRQYVPLGVSLLVIIDILLGSPMANGLLNKIRPTDVSTNEVNDTNNMRESPTNNNNNNNMPLSKERIDSQKVAQDAIQRARYTLELRAFLDAQRDPIVELQRKMDQQAAVLEQNQNNLQAALQQQQQLQQPKSSNNSNDTELQK